ncbi:class I SAM-dependent methyltransferase [Nannocystis sp. SCPEA4]|uniref:class I SAM-dependent methyltransferase n=1 Tax=Nannocystis sp. SCPEA4 TaxID=2996787 RepID=UPI00227151FF|nr:class I SAM-dependent methyltransferase [Nannocystis sp. SCPEA4]MCY1060904.1 class I SAM-dependent methyltransferase [Nannocystis sp. SCPEA4]
MTDSDRVPHPGVPPQLFEQAYEGTPPWDIGAPQAAFVELADAGLVRGDVLDVGCGPGDNALMAAERGHAVLGVDFVAEAIARAQAKAAARGLEVRFLVHDALNLAALGRRFATIFDSGLFHVFSDRDRIEYERSLAAAIEPGGLLHILCFSDEEVGEGGPRRVSQAELHATFNKGWRVTAIRPARFASHLHPGGARAWCATIERARDV